MNNTCGKSETDAQKLRKLVNFYSLRQLGITIMLLHAHNLTMKTTVTYLVCATN
jgi:hypothetical protein